MKSISKRSGFALVDALAIFFLVLVAAALFYKGVTRASRAQAPTKAQRIKCVSNLHQIGLAARLYATDNNFKMPGAFFQNNEAALAKSPVVQYIQMLSNELSSTELLLCPSDDARTNPAADFARLAPQNISYFMSISADETTPKAFLGGDRNLQMAGKPVPPGLFALSRKAQLGWTDKLHRNEGNILMGIGSVLQFTNPELSAAVAAQGIATNLLIIP